MDWSSESRESASQTEINAWVQHKQQEEEEEEDKKKNKTQMFLFAFRLRRGCAGLVTLATGSRAVDWVWVHVSCVTYRGGQGVKIENQYTPYLWG